MARKPGWAIAGGAARREQAGEQWCAQPTPRDTLNASGRRMGAHDHPTAGDALAGDRRTRSPTGAISVKIELTDTPLLAAPKVGELASFLDALHTRVLKAIERLNRDVAIKKAEIASRWKTAGIDAADRARFAQSETLAAIGIIKDNSRAELDKLLKEAGPPHAQLIAQRPYYDSPVKVLSRAALGDARRTAYLQQLAHAGPAELGHMAQVAVGTKNEALAAAVLSRLDAMPTKDRPVSSQALASAMQLDDYVKVREYLKIGDARLQGIVLAVRAWNQGKSSPLNTLALAMRERDIDASVLGELGRGD